jgi:hypothetical protein
MEEHGATLRDIKAEIGFLQEAADRRWEQLSRQVDEMQEWNAHALAELQALKAELQGAKQALEKKVSVPERVQLEERLAALETDIKGLRYEIQETVERLWRVVPSSVSIGEPPEEPGERFASETLLEQEASGQGESLLVKETPPGGEKSEDAPTPMEVQELEEEPSSASLSRIAEAAEQERQRRIRIPPPSPRTRRQVPPEKRGGRPRAGTVTERVVEGASPQAVTEAVTARADSSLPHAPSTTGPEVLCLKRGREWKVLLSLPEELLGKPELEVRQGGSLLEREGEMGWLLPQMEEDVEATWREGGEIRTLRAFAALDEVEGLLFKLNQDLKQGRRVRKASQGWYLAIVPQGWQRTGSLPIAPEPVVLPGYVAHYFDLSQDPRVAFLVDGEERVPWQRIEFQLIGKKIPDASERLGPLFRDPPEVRAERSVWAEIATVVIGEEGPGKRRWKTSFRPDPARETQPLLEELVARGGGWYFLRFYDQTDELVDSLDFRFLSALEEIHVKPEGPVVVPGPEGHRSARVEFHHEPGCQVEPLDPPLKVHEEPRRTIAEIPPEPEMDRTRWRVQMANGAPSTQPATVEVEVCVPRIWWALGEDEGFEQREPEGLAWQAQPSSLSREDFAATSRRAIWLKLPPRIRRISFGFPGDLRPFTAKTGSGRVGVPLREFTDVESLRHPGRTALLVQFETPEGRCEVEIGRLEIRRGCRFCDFTALEDEALLKHLFGEHRSELYREPDWAELRQWIPDLPPAIYQCHYCKEYVESDDPHHPTSTITRHVEEAHNPRARGENISIRIVRDTEEIRSRIAKYRDLPRFQICKFCQEHFDLRELGEEELLRHVKERHWREVSGLQ